MGLGRQTNHFGAWACLGHPCLPHNATRAFLQSMDVELGASRWLSSVGFPGHSKRGGSIILRPKLIFWGA